MYCIDGGYATCKIQNVEHGGLVMISGRSPLHIFIWCCCISATVYLLLFVSHCVSATVSTVLYIYNCISYCISTTASTVLYIHCCICDCIFTTVYLSLYIHHLVFPSVSAAVYLPLCLLYCILPVFLQLYIYRYISTSEFLPR
jgi:hypothetical protein